MNDRLKQLYQKVILQESKAPYNYEKKPEATKVIEANNPVCGDRFTLYLEVEDDTIRSAHFYGHGCAISKASTSILTRHLEGKPLSAIPTLSAQMLRVADPQADISDLSEDLQAFEAARFFPDRSSCATLSWEAVGRFGDFERV